MENIFGTATHTKESGIVYENTVYEKNFSKSYNSAFNAGWRFLRKYISSLLRKRKKKNFTTILYVTFSEPRFDFFLALKKQYPDKEVKVIVPLKSQDDGEKLMFDFEYYIQNRSNTAYLYKLKTNSQNIDVYGLYSEAFGDCDFQRLQYLAPFTRAVRCAAKKLKPDIIHADNFPFFLGFEFEKKSRFPIKVLQVINDFSQYESNKKETFWSAVNLADKSGMQRLCRDKTIKKCIASLFNLHNIRQFYQMRECLDFIYQNYFKFRRYVDKCDDADENILFERMNSRVLKLFPQMTYEDSTYYNMMFYTLKRTDFWAVPSKTYYDALFINPELTGKMYKRITETKDKSAYIHYGYEIHDYELFKPFTTENFRGNRILNKTYILKEFSRDRIRTKFVDPKLLKYDECIIKGYLDAFYDAPLIFCKFSSCIYQEGADIALTVILKFFELYKNIQVIINIPDGFKNNSVKQWVEFLEKKSDFNGKWLFIDGNINQAQFYASSDMSVFFCKTK